MPWEGQSHLCKGCTNPILQSAFFASYCGSWRSSHTRWLTFSSEDTPERCLGGLVGKCFEELYRPSGFPLPVVPNLSCPLFFIFPRVPPQGHMTSYRWRISVHHSQSFGPAQWLAVTFFAAKKEMCKGRMRKRIPRTFMWLFENLVKHRKDKGTTFRCNVRS